MKLIQLLETFLCSLFLLGLSADTNTNQLSPSAALLSEMWAPLLPDMVEDGELILPSWAIAYLEEGDFTLPPDAFKDDESLQEVPEEVPEEIPEETPVQHQYGSPVPENPPVNENFFANTAIIGDSRAKGLMAFGNMSGVDLTAEALSIYNLWTKTYDSLYGNMTILDALTYEKFDKIYIALGINSVGYPSRDQFYNLYSQFIDEIRLLLPNVEIYIHSIMPVNETILHQKGTNYHINNTVIQEYNKLIANLAGEKQVYFLDIFPYFLDETGQLPQNAGTDGLHLGGEYARRWTNYLYTHAVTWGK